MDSTVSQLARELAASEASVRRAAAEKLAQLGPDAAPAALALVRACGNELADVRDWAVAALEEIAAPPANEIEKLAGMLGADSSLVGYWAATLLGRLGDQAAPAVPALARVLAGGGDLAVRERTAWALGKIGPAAAAALPALEQAANGDVPRLSRLAVEAIESVT